MPCKSTTCTCNGPSLNLNRHAHKKGHALLSCIINSFPNMLNGTDNMGLMDPGAPRTGVSSSRAWEFTRGFGFGTLTGA